MAHLNHPFFDFFNTTCTENASLLLLYNGAKKSKMTKHSNQGGSCLKSRRTWKDWNSKPHPRHITSPIQLVLGPDRRVVFRPVKCRRPVHYCFLTTARKLLLKKCPQSKDFQDWLNSRESSVKKCFKRQWSTVMVLRDSQFRPVCPTGHVQV